MSTPIRTLDQRWLLPFEGLDLLLAPGNQIEPGDIYIARRNGDWKLLTCQSVQTTDNYILPVELDYPYDIYECWKVVDIHEKLTH